MASRLKRPSGLFLHGLGVVLFLGLSTDLCRLRCSHVEDLLGSNHNAESSEPGLQSSFSVSIFLETVLLYKFDGIGGTCLSFTSWNHPRCHLTRKESECAMYWTILLHTFQWPRMLPFQLRI